MMIMIIYIFSELIMALLTLYLMPISGEEIRKIKHSRLIISLFLVAAISVCFNKLFYFPNIAIQSLILIINYIKFIAAAIIVYKRISIKIVCLSLIIHSVCSILVAGISFVAPIKQDVASYESEITLMDVRILFLLFAVIFKKKRTVLYVNNKFFKILPNHIYILILINLFLADGLIEAANYEFADLQIKEIIVKILAVTLSICVIVTLVTLLINVASKKYFIDINKLLEKQIQTQISYYEDRERTYAEIRRFKHDYINHINCIRSLLKAERYDEVSEYLGSITDMLPSGNLLFNTGNFISDAILSDKQNSVKRENISIQFDGIIPSSINNADLCIILGNAVDNAIEASRELDGEKMISVYGGFSHSYFILTVTNPTNNVTNNSGFIPITTKQDKSEHGFGLMNIKSVVDKYDGCMKIENNENQFTLNLTFNSIIAECEKD